MRQFCTLNLSGGVRGPLEQDVTHTAVPPAAASPRLTRNRRKANNRCSGVGKKASHRRSSRVIGPRRSFVIGRVEVWAQRSVKISAKRNMMSRSNTADQAIARKVRPIPRVCRARSVIRKPVWEGKTTVETLCFWGRAVFFHDMKAPSLLGILT